MDVEFCNGFSMYRDDHITFFFFIMVITLIFSVNQFCIPGINPIWSYIVLLLNYWIQLANFCLE